jgi:DNA processing protein
MAWTEAAALLALSRLKGIGSRRTVRLCSAFGSAVAAATASAGERSAALGRRVPSGRPDLARAEAELTAWTERGIAAIALGGERYPADLASIYDPPPVLYVRGEVRALAGRAVAVVGSRSCSAHGAGFAAALAGELAQRGVAVVSGLAYGIDAAAHRGAMEAGATVAVLGSPVDRATPAGQRPLGEQIVSSSGALVSEYPPGSPVAPGNFVERNRIVSGLCAGVVVVEAGERSGALHTCDFALEQGRAVMAVPGRPSDPTSAGTLALLRDGAVPVAGVAHVMAELGWADAGATTAKAELSLLEAALVRIGPCTLEALVAELTLPATELLVELGRLELRGSVRRTPGGRFAWERS